MRLVDVDDPQPGAGQLVVKVLASPANFPDVLMCRGTYQVKPDLPFTPGVELCGEVVALGDGVTGFAVGDRVLGGAVLPYGGFGELAVMDAATTFPAPEALDDAQAASLYIGYQTGWFGLHRRAALQPGETLLVHAAAGGVGSAAVQLGKAAGAKVIGVVGGADKAKVAYELGADVVVDRREHDFIDVVKAETGGRGVDVVYDPVGGDTYRRSTKCIAFEGRILVVGFAGGEIQSAALNHALVKNYSIVGLHWGLYNRFDPRCGHRVPPRPDAARCRGRRAPAGQRAAHARVRRRRRPAARRRRNRWPRGLRHGGRHDRDPTGRWRGLRLRRRADHSGARLDRRVARCRRDRPASFSRTLKSWLSRDVSWNTPIHRLEIGELSAEEFGRLLTAELTTVDGRSVDPAGVLDRLFAGMRPDPEMFALARQAALFPSPVAGRLQVSPGPVGELLSRSASRGRGLRRFSRGCILERDGGDKPACVVDPMSVLVS